MQTMRDKVAIIGMGCTPYGDHYDKGTEDLLVEACGEAFEDAGVGPRDIQAAWLGNLGDNTLGGQPLGSALKLDFIPISRVENACATGGDAFRNAAGFVAGGLFDMVLVAGVTHGEGAEAGPRNGYALGGPPGTYRHGQNATYSGAPASTFSTFATRYAHRYGLSFEQLKQGLGAIAIKNYHNGAMNPKAWLHKEITFDQYMNAPWIAWPLGLHDCCAMPDGAAAAIITTPEIAQGLRSDYVLLRGLGMSVGNMDGRLNPQYDWVHFPENVRAGQVAYQMAGIADPLHELDLACIHDAFTVVELCVYEDLAWAPRGKGGDLARSGVFDLEGELAVNPNGGLKSFGHGGGSSGIHKLYEVYKQLQGKCGPRQVKNASVGLTHDQGGLPGIYTTVINILSTRD
ncbi:MAG: acetyl-CoA acetyltransferase [Chloroflexi bacterium]|nr:acetyl-CoA acetyltransferase [Chloroflexota bacterium]